MHNLSIALKNSGCIVSGSDDKIYNPSRDRLVANDLFPEKERGATETPLKLMLWLERGIKRSWRRSRQVIQVILF